MTLLLIFSLFLSFWLFVFENIVLVGNKQSNHMEVRNLGDERHDSWKYNGTLKCFHPIHFHIVLPVSNISNMKVRNLGDERHDSWKYNGTLKCFHPIHFHIVLPVSNISNMEVRNLGDERHDSWKYNGTLKCLSSHTFPHCLTCFQYFQYESSTPG